MQEKEGSKVTLRFLGEGMRYLVVPFWRRETRIGVEWKLSFKDIEVEGSAACPSGQARWCWPSFTHSTSAYCVLAASQSLGVHSELNKVPNLGRVPSGGETINK